VYSHHCFRPAARFLARSPKHSALPETTTASLRPSYLAAMPNSWLMFMRLEVLELWAFLRRGGVSHKFDFPSQLPTDTLLCARLMPTRVSISQSHALTPNPRIGGQLRASLDAEGARERESCLTSLWVANRQGLSFYHFVVWLSHETLWPGVCDENKSDGKRGEHSQIMA
jgi:hypothetical protein